MEAASLGKICTVSCFCCSHTFQCIADAKYVICPSCRVIGPAGGDGGNNDNHNFGVGLGFCARDLPRKGESSSSRRQVVPLVTGWFPSLYSPQQSSRSSLDIAYHNERVESICSNIDFPKTWEALGIQPII
jgi:hypothetical protein